MSSTATIELRQRQKPEMDSQDNDFSSSEVTHSLVNEQMKQATEPLLQQVELLCAVLASRNELETARNSEATVFGRRNTSNSPGDNR